eukprot:GHVU01125677.1.p5 GENE.GHVU01125677.1~~GHVU01125677.1.p5  ORF type:complete len:101 (-),score=0.89 GHVU01125677.1:136-438(-)
MTTRFTLSNQSENLLTWYRSASRNAYGSIYILSPWYAGESTHSRLLVSQSSWLGKRSNCDVTLVHAVYVDAQPGTTFWAIKATPDRLMGVPEVMHTIAQG